MKARLTAHQHKYTHTHTPQEILNFAGLKDVSIFRMREKMIWIQAETETDKVV